MSDGEKGDRPEEQIESLCPKWHDRPGVFDSFGECLHNKGLYVRFENCQLEDEKYFELGLIDIA